MARTRLGPLAACHAGGRWIRVPSLPTTTVCRACRRHPAYGASLDPLMRQPSQKNAGHPALASADRCHSRSRATIATLLGLGFGDRFEAPRGGSGVFDGRVLQAANQPNCRESSLLTALPGAHSSGKILHGKEGVDGSSPSEGLQNPRLRGFSVQDDLLFVERAVGMELFMDLSRFRPPLFRRRSLLTPSIATTRRLSATAARKRAAGQELSSSTRPRLPRAVGLHGGLRAPLPACSGGSREGTRARRRPTRGAPRAVGAAARAGREG
jgi:hypothetical protein